MVPAKGGLSTARKAGVVIVLIVIVLGVAYLAMPLVTGGSTSTTSSSARSSSGALAGSGNTIGLLSLFGNFSQMKIWTASYDHGEGGGPQEQHNFSYIVLGKAPLNSTPHTKVRFSEVGTSGDIVAWFNSQGSIDRVDVLGATNYTGSVASLYAQKYLSALLSVTGSSNSSSILPPLKQTSQTTMSIGSTQMSVSAYQLAAPTSPFTNVTVRFATVPGTNAKVLVYLDENTNDNMETVFQVTSLTK